MREAEKKLRELDVPSSLFQSLDSKLEDAYNRDLTSFKLLVEFIDAAELASQNFLEKLNIDWRVSAKLSQNQVQEANKLFERVMKVRNIQNQIEDENPQLRLEKQKQIDEIVVPELPEAF